MPRDRLDPSRRTSGWTPVSTRVWSAGRLVVLGGLLAVTFGLFFLTAVRVTTRAREVRVPDLKGKALTVATAAIGDAGLDLRVDARRADASVPPDHVLWQDPEPGTVTRRGRIVRIRVSEGRLDPVVPAVVGQLERTAEIVLAQDKVEIGGRAEVFTSAYPAGSVIAQDPPAEGRAAKISLLVNHCSGAASYVMPDVIGTLAGRVVAILRQRGFRVSVAAEVPYPGLPPGIVVKQTPQAGFQVGYGDAVLLEVTR